MTEAPERIWAWWDTEYDVGCFNKHGINPYTPSNATKYTRSDLVDPAAKSLDEHTALAIRAAALREAAYVAFNACLVPPDGGNPTEEERLVCDEASRRILALIQVSASQNDKKEG